MKYGEGLGFTAYKKLENHQEKIADEIKLGFVCNQEHQQYDSYYECTSSQE